MYFYSGCMIAAIFKSMQIKKTEENGRAVHLVICDVQSAYAENLLKILMEKLPDDYELRLFSDIDRLKAVNKRRPADILLIGEEYEEQERRELPAGRKFLMTGSRDSPVCEEIPVFRYQPAEKILEKVLSGSSEEKGCTGEVHAERADREGRKKPVQTAVKGLIGIYSPIRRIGRTRFALRLGRQLAEKADVLYLNLENFNGFETLFDQNYSADISDLLYFARQNEGNLIYRLSGMIRSLGRLDYIPPAFSPGDLRDVGHEEWISLFSRMEAWGDYEVIILDLGSQIEDVFQILKRCGRVYMPVLDDPVSRAKLLQFEKNLRALECGEVEEKLVRLHLPRWGRGEELELPQTLAGGTLGRYVRQLLETGRDEGGEP